MEMKNKNWLSQIIIHVNLLLFSLLGLNFFIMAYKTELLSGNWQKKRLEIMNRDEFRCRNCHASDNLTVHHLHYDPGLKLWEYDNESLVTLCNDCHNSLHKQLVKLSGIIAFNLLIGHVDLSQFNLYANR